MSRPERNDLSALSRHDAAEVLQERCCYCGEPLIYRGDKAIEHRYLKAEPFICVACKVMFVIKSDPVSVTVEEVMEW